MTVHEPAWGVEVEFTIDDNGVYARAYLRAHGHELVGHGAARCNPSTQQVSGLGVHAAAAAALRDLARHVDAVRPALVR